MSPFTKARTILVVVISLALALGVGLELRWFERAPTPSEIRDLEVSWQRVGDLAASVEPGPGALEPLQDLLDSWEGNGGGPEAERVQGLLRLLEERPDSTLDGSTQFVTLLKVTDAATRSEALEGPDLLALAQLAGRLRGGGDLLQFAAGTHLLGSALERCRLEPSLFEALDELEPPQPDELFRAVCREALRSPAVTGLDPGEGERGEVFIRDAARQALVDLVLQLEHRRHDPSTWSELGRPEPPGALRTWWGLQTLDRGIMAAKIAGLVWPTLDGITEGWVGTVSKWNELVEMAEER